MQHIRAVRAAFAPVGISEPPHDPKLGANCSASIKRLVFKIPENIKKTMCQNNFEKFQKYY